MTLQTVSLLPTGHHAQAVLPKVYLVRPSGHEPRVLKAAPTWEVAFDKRGPLTLLPSMGLSSEISESRGPVQGRLGGSVG